MINTIPTIKKQTPTKFSDIYNGVFTGGNILQSLFYTGNTSNSLISFNSLAFFSLKSFSFSF